MTALLDHTSDVAILAEGYSQKNLFSNALWQMNNVLLPGYCGGTRHYDCKMRLRLHGSDPTVLLVDFLSEALALTYIQRAIFCYVHFEVLNRTLLAGHLYGRWYKELDNEIKAVTYHEANVSQDAIGKWTSPILFDL